MKDIFDSKPKEEIPHSAWLSAFQSDNFDLKPIGFNGAYIQFHVRYGTDEEFEAVFKRVREVIDLPEGEQETRLFAIYKDALGKFSTKEPTLKLSGKSIAAGGKDAVEAVNALFPAFDKKAFRILQKAWLEFRQANEPDVNFQ